MNQPCTANFSTVWPFYSGQQVSPCFEWIVFQFQHVRLHHCQYTPFWTYLELLFPSSTGSMDSGVIQSPRHLVKGKEQKARMQCTPIKEHSYVYWYYKKLGEDLKFLVYFQNTDIIDKTDMIKKIISAECFTNKTCTIEIKSSKLTDSAVYYCASSQSTVLTTGFS